MAGLRRLLGRCPVFFLLAAAFDALGLGLILFGIFARLELSGRSFGEFLIYGGGILLFFSLLWWLAWYSLNLEVALHELLEDPKGPPKRSNLAQLARKISERLSRRGRVPSKDNLGGPTNLPEEPLHLTPTVFINSGFSSPLDSVRVCEDHLQMSPVAKDHLEMSLVAKDLLELSPAPALTQHMVDRLV